MSLLKSPFWLPQLMLQPTVDTLLGHDLGVALFPLDPANADTFARRAATGNPGLRHQVAVLQRSRPRRVRLAKMDHWLWLLLPRPWVGWRVALVIVNPETVIAWHRRGFQLWWTWKSRRRLGRPTVPVNIRTLIREMAEANRSWGAPRMHAELLKLGIDVRQATVAKYMRCRRQPPSSPPISSWFPP
jgi:hypothetical protein